MLANLMLVFIAQAVLGSQSDSITLTQNTSSISFSSLPKTNATITERSLLSGHLFLSLASVRASSPLLRFGPCEALLLLTGVAAIINSQ